MFLLYVIISFSLTVNFAPKKKKLTVDFGNGSKHMKLNVASVMSSD